MRSMAIALLASVLCVNAASALERRTLTADDINALHELDDPRVAPDGEWVAYTVRTADLVKDKRRTHIWMTSWNGERSLQLTEILKCATDDQPRLILLAGAFAHFLESVIDQIQLERLRINA